MFFLQWEKVHHQTPKNEACYLKVPKKKKNNLRKKNYVQKNGFYLLQKFERVRKCIIQGSNAQSLKHYEKSDLSEN